MNIYKQFLVKTLFLLIVALATVGVRLMTDRQPAAAEVSAEPASALVGPNNCRYGVADLGGSSFFDQLGVGWAVNFEATNTSYPDNIEYVPIIRLKQNKNSSGQRLQTYSVSPPLTNGGLGAMITANPGKLWLIGNEVDRHTFQDDIMPDLYAVAYHDIYHYIKQRDPSAQVAISGLVRVSPGRLQYLDIVWNSYLQKYGTEIPVDVWNLHTYNLAEKLPNGGDAGAAVALGTDPNLAYIYGAPLIAPGSSPAQVNQICGANNIVCTKESDKLDDFIKQVQDMRQWMFNHGQRNKPLILSEFSLLEPYNPEGNGCFIMDELGQCFTPERVTNFMEQTLNYLETAASATIGYPPDNNRLVQRWLWYPSQVTNNDDVGSSSKLVTNNGVALTSMGTKYKAFATDTSKMLVNIGADRVNSAVATKAPATVPLSAIIRNNGTIATSGNTPIVFRNNIGVEIGRFLIPTKFEGCSMQPVTASVQWKNVPAGTHYFSVFAGNTFIGSGLVLVEPPYQLSLPVLSK